MSRLRRNHYILLELDPFVEAADGAVLYLQSLTGSLDGFSGNLTKSTSHLLAGALGGFAGTCTNAATFLSACSGALSGFAGSVTTLFIQGANNVVNILNRLRRRGDL